MYVHVGRINRAIIRAAKAAKTVKNPCKGFAVNLCPIPGVFVSNEEEEVIGAEEEAEGAVVEEAGSTGFSA
jgi:hypothetical protein